MEEFYKMNKLSTKTMFLIHDNIFSGYLPSFYQEFNTEVYDPKKESIASHTSHGLKDVFVVGESFSTRQAWIEGALEHVEQLFEKHAGELYTLR